MTDLEILEKSCATSKRFNEMLYQLKNNSSDGIENISDLKEQYGNKSGMIYNPEYTYAAGYICSLDNNIYISRLDNNLNNTPSFEGDTTYWKKVEIKNLIQGFYYTSALCRVSQSVYNTNNFANYSIKSSYNITSMVDYGNGLFRINFDLNAGLFDSNYLVMSSSKAGLFAQNPYNRSVFNDCNVVQKTDTYVMIKVAFNRYTEEFSFAIVPLQ